MTILLVLALSIAFLVSLPVRASGRGALQYRIAGLGLLTMVLLAMLVTDQV